jgi:hypothetical protein
MKTPNLAANAPDFVREMEKSELTGLEAQPYYCCAEWHLARLGGACGVVHSFAVHLSYKSKRFGCSAVALGKYLDLNECTIRRAYRKLEGIGFFEKVFQGVFGPSVYRVLDHQEWAAIHPNRCPEKFEYHWAGKGDPLAQQLYGASGGRIRFMEFQMKSLRTLDVSEDRILNEFDRYLENEGKYKKNIASGFCMHLKRKLKSGG